MTETESIEQFEGLALKEETEGEKFQQQTWLIEEYERVLEDRDEETKEVE